jgi:hypothetical protein
VGMEHNQGPLRTTYVVGSARQYGLASVIKHVPALLIQDIAAGTRGWGCRSMRP